MNLKAALLLFVFTVPTLISCSRVSFFRPNKPDGPGVVVEKCTSHEFDQPVGGYNKVDILFITDTSGSLDAQRADVAASISSFVNELDPDVDYQIGVLLGHGSLDDATPSYTGMLWQSHYNEPVVLKSSELSLTDIENELFRKLSNIDNDFWGDGGELGMYSLTNLISGAGYIEAKAEGFFRDDAALSVIFLADENDICAEYPQGITPEPDMDCYIDGVHTQGQSCDEIYQLEYMAKQRDCHGITARGTINDLYDVVGERPLLVGGIIYLNPDTIPDIFELEVGYGYTDMINLASVSAAIDLATGDIPGGLQAIGQLTNTNLQFTEEYRISTPGVIEDTIEVRIDGTLQTLDTDYTYESSWQLLSFLNNGGPGAHFRIDWCYDENAANPKSFGNDLKVTTRSFSEPEVLEIEALCF
jgi:hypothetical protein